MMRIAMMTKIGVTMITKVSRCRQNHDYNENKDENYGNLCDVKQKDNPFPSQPLQQKVEYFVAVVEYIAFLQIATKSNPPKHNEV